MFKKITFLLAALILVSSNLYAVEQWDKTKPLGTDDPSDLDTITQTNNEALDRLVFGYRKDCTVVFDSTTQVEVRPGEIAIPNSGGTVVRWRKNASELTLTAASNMDSGTSFTNSTQYYVYITADDDEAGFDAFISANSSAPSGKTYYRKVGYFYVNSAGEITSVGNIAGGDVVNSVRAVDTSNQTTTSTSYADVTGMIVYFVSSGRPIELNFSGIYYPEGIGTITYTVFDVDGTDYGESLLYAVNSNHLGLINGNTRIEGLSAGTHTVKLQWKVNSSTTRFCGAATGENCVAGVGAATIMEVTEL